MKESLKN